MPGGVRDVRSNAHPLAGRGEIERSRSRLRLEAMIRTGMTLSDEPSVVPVTALVAREQAFQALVDARLEASYRLAAMLLGDRTEAEDATHDAVVRAWRSFGGLRDPASIDAWFQRIVVNICRDRLRHRRARSTVELAPDLPDASRAGDHATALSDRDAVRVALGLLSPDHRVVLVLRFYADLQIDDIARRLDERPGTIKSRLHQAIRALRAAYRRRRPHTLGGSPMTDRDHGGGHPVHLPDRRRGAAGGRDMVHPPSGTIRITTIGSSGELVVFVDDTRIRVPRSQPSNGWGC